MKKIIALALATVMMVVCFASCGSETAKVVASKDDLAGAKIGVQLGTTGDDLATSYEKQEVTGTDGATMAKATVERYGKGADAVQALKQGKIDAVIIDNQPAEAFVKTNDDLKILDDSFDKEEYAACFKKGSKLVEEFNKAYDELKKDGTVDSIINNFIGDNAGKSPYTTPAGTDHSKGTLVMATNAEFAPWEYVEDKQVVGIDPMLALAICDKMGYELKIEDIAFDSIITEIASGKADFGMAGMTIDETRLKSVDFSTPYATASQVIIVKK